MEDIFSPQPLPTWAEVCAHLSDTEKFARIVEQIEADPDIKVRTMAGGKFRIANCRPSLPYPESIHQLVSKGLVYKPAPPGGKPFLVSAPFCKMYNYGRHTPSDKTFQTLRQDGQEYIVTEKMDGTLIHAFKGAAGAVYFATRGAGEGGDEEFGGPDYCTLARGIAQDKYPAMFDPDVQLLEHGFVVGLTFELIHPDTHVITDYGDEQDLYLIGGMKLIGGRVAYMTSYDLGAVAEALECPRPKTYRSGNLVVGMHVASAHLRHTRKLPEGVVVTLEDGSGIFRETVFGVKIKMNEYLKAHRLQTQCTYDHVFEMCWNNDLLTWEDVKAHLKAAGSLEEETEAEYLKHFETFCDEVTRASSALVQAAVIVSEEARKHTDRSALCKALALAHRGTLDSGVFAAMMSFARKNRFTLYDYLSVAKPIKNFRGKCTADAALCRGEAVHTLLEDRKARRDV